MEENMTRAIFIAVAVFISMISLSLVMVYYNTARNVADVVNDRQDIAKVFDDIVTNFEVYNRELNGIELRSLIRKYANNENVEINIVSISNVPVSGARYTNINNNPDWINSDGILDQRIASEIDPVWMNMVNKIEPLDSEDKKIKLEVHLNHKYDK